MASRIEFRKMQTREDLQQIKIPVALEDGRIPLENMEEDLQLLIPTFAGVKANDQFKLYVRDTYLGNSYTLSSAEAADPDFEVPLSISKAGFPPPGTSIEVNLDYEYVDADTQNGVRSGKVFVVIFDREAPGGTPLRALGFTPEQKEGITEEDLEAGFLPVTAYAWYGMDTGDFITPWVSERPPSEATQDQYLIKDAAVEVSAPGTSTVLKFPASRFQGVGDRYFGYQLRDKLGNTSALSSTVTIPVDLKSTK